MIRKHAAAIMMLITHKSNGKKILVCSLNTYFIGNAIKYLEIAYCIYRMKCLLERTNNSNINFNVLNIICMLINWTLNVPIILAGDFNAVPNSAVIAYLYGR